MKLRPFAFTATFTILWCLSISVVASDQPTGQDAASQAPSAIASSEKPTVVMPKLKHEFDPVVDGTQITHDFTIKNTGNGPLAIERVKTG